VAKLCHFNVALVCVNKFSKPNTKKALVEVLSLVAKRERGQSLTNIPPSLINILGRKM
jgi:hypothetical protein